MSNNNRNSNGIHGVVIFIIPSLLIIAFAFLLTADCSKGKTPVEATIVSEKNDSWYAKYTVNGIEYTSSVNGNTDNLRVGKKLTLYYDKNNPGKIWHSIDRNKAILIRSIFIGFPSIIVILILISSKTSKKQQSDEESQQYQNPYENNSENNRTYNNINKF